jgi:hypothetical protein
MSTPTMTSTIEDAATSSGAEATGIVVAVGAVAFGIKALWVAWRAGRKAVNATGT